MLAAHVNPDPDAHPSHRHRGAAHGDAHPPYSHAHPADRYLDAATANAYADPAAGHAHANAYLSGNSDARSSLAHALCHGSPFRYGNLNIGADVCAHIHAASNGDPDAIAHAIRRKCSAS